MYIAVLVCVNYKWRAENEILTSMTTPSIQLDRMSIVNPRLTLCGRAEIICDYQNEYDLTVDQFSDVNEWGDNSSIYRYYST